MKHFLLTTITFLVFTVTSRAQNTPWPTSGAVGIGTLTPAGIFQVQTAATDFLVTGNTFDIGLKGGTGGWARAFRVVNSSGSNGTDGGAFGVVGTGTTPAYIYMAIPTTDLLGYTSTKILALNNSGNVGIGTAAPSEKLHVLGGVRVGDGLSVSNVSSGVLSLKLGNLNTTWNSTTDSFVGVQNTGGPGAGLAGDLLLIPRTSIDAGIRMLTGSSGTATERLTILGGTGNVGIGTTNPGSYKLAVNGGIHSQSVNVDMTGWSDYVFKQGHHLPTLQEVKTYIDQNHHLPEIPSEREVVENGINLGEMNKLLLKKVEELTLYLMEQNKQITKQSKQLTDQQKINKSLQQQIGNLKKQQN
jgi:hypothetical protein